MTTGIDIACRVNPQVGQVALPELASKILSSCLVAEESQNQNAGFVAWFCTAVLLQDGRRFRQEVTPARK